MNGTVQQRMQDVLFRWEPLIEIRGWLGGAPFN